MEAQYDCGLCVLCQEGEKEIGIVKVGGKGLATLLEYCRLKLKHDLEMYLLSRKRKTKELQVLVHESCRRDFTNHLRLGQISVLCTQIV